jgi:phenylalanyl-tRNA synthetase beta subunit
MKGETVKVGHKVYKIKYVKRVDAQDSYGECVSSKSEIRIKRDQTPSEMGNTLLHEDLHALCENMGLRLDHSLEEKIVTAFANGLSALIVDNPDHIKKIIRLLTDGK